MPYNLLFSVRTCDKKASCPFSRLQDLEHSGPYICEKVFKMTLKDVQQNVDFTNIYYGGREIKQSNIVFVNGKFSTDKNANPNKNHTQTIQFISPRKWYIYYCVKYKVLGVG